MKFTNLLLLTFGLFYSVCNAQDAKEIEKQKSKLILFEEEKLDDNLANLQKKYPGKVVFSNSEILRDDVNSNSESKLIKSYTFGENLFIRAFYSKSMMNDMFLQMVDKGIKAKDINNANNNKNFDTRFRIYLYLDGKEVSVVEDNRTEMNTSLTHSATLNDGVDIGDNSDLKFGEWLFKDLKSKFELLTPGKHTLKIAFIPVLFSNSIQNKFNFTSIAQGEIEMVVKETKIDKNDRDVCMPTAKMKDKELETKIINLVKSKGFKIDPKKVNLVSDKWTVKRNEYGIILKRNIDSYVGYIKDGKCKMMNLYINQDYDGTKYQDEIYYSNGIDFVKDKVISCECLK